MRPKNRFPWGTKKKITVFFPATVVQTGLEMCLRFLEILPFEVSPKENMSFSSQKSRNSGAVFALHQPVLGVEGIYFSKYPARGAILSNMNTFARLEPETGLVGLVWPVWLARSGQSEVGQSRSPCKVILGADVRWGPIRRAFA